VKFRIYQGAKSDVREELGEEELEAGLDFRG
jgi:hypothetical protein